MTGKEKKVVREDNSKTPDTSNESATAPAEVADDRKARRALEKALSLTCPLCLGVFWHPKLLPCSHTFCRDCLETLLNHKSSSSFACPTCRQEIKVPQLGVAGFQENFYINPDDLKRARRQCPIHAGKAVLDFCVTCDVPLCLHCLQAPTHANHVTHELMEEDLVGSTLLAAAEKSSPTSWSSWKSLCVSAGNLWDSVWRRTGLRRKRAVSIPTRKPPCGPCPTSKMRERRSDSKVWMSLQRTRCLLRDTTLTLHLRTMGLIRRILGFGRKKSMSMIENSPAEAARKVGPANAIQENVLLQTSHH